MSDPCFRSFRESAVTDSGEDFFRTGSISLEATLEGTPKTAATRFLIRPPFWTIYLRR